MTKPIEKNTGTIVSWAYWARLKYADGRIDMPEDERSSDYFNAISIKQIE